MIGNRPASDNDDPGVATTDTPPWLGTAGRLLLGGVWVTAGVLKLPDPAAGLRAVRAYRLLPGALVAPVAFGLPVVEIGIGLALLVGVAVRLAAVSSGVLLAVFIAAVVSAWARGLEIDCGCFGNGGEVGLGGTAYASEVLRDAALLAVALALGRWPRTRLALLERAGGDRPASRRDAPAGPPAAAEREEDSHVPRS
jgi:uncharacterized membrane protein YphA (DoxX/SURF4 family)